MSRPGPSPTAGSICVTENSCISSVTLSQQSANTITLYPRIGGVPGGAFGRRIRDDAGNHERRDVVDSQETVELSPGEAADRTFANHQLPLDRSEGVNELSPPMSLRSSAPPTSRRLAMV